MKLVALLLNTHWRILHTQSIQGSICYALFWLWTQTGWKFCDILCRRDKGSSQAESTGTNCQCLRCGITHHSLKRLHGVHLFEHYFPKSSQSCFLLLKKPLLNWEQFWTALRNLMFYESWFFTYREITYTFEIDALLTTLFLKCKSIIYLHPQVMSRNNWNIRRTTDKVKLYNKFELFLKGKKIIQ